MMNVALFFVVFSSTLFHECLCHSSGAPDSQCESMIPGHGPPAQTDPSPYEIKLEKTYYTPGENVKVYIESSTGDNILGLLIQARKVGENTAIGMFAEPPANTKHLTCNSIAKSAITHNRKLTMKKIEFEWEPPMDLTGNILFLATVVKSQNIFWVKIKSLELMNKMEIPMMAEVTSSSITSVMASMTSATSVYAQVSTTMSTMYVESIKPTTTIMVAPETTSVYVRVSKGIAKPTVNNTMSVYIRVSKGVPTVDNTTIATTKPTTSGNTFIPNIFITLVALIFVIGQLI